MASRFFDLIPEQHLSLMGLSDGPAKTAALEQAYDEGFCGCFLPDMDGPMGSIARWHEDEFREFAGRNSYRFEDFAAEPCAADVEHGHVASVDAFDAWQRDRSPQAVDWLYGVQQNWGDCVDASLVELQHGALGVRAMDPANREAFKWLMAFYAYAFRGYCGHGWYTSAAGSVSLQHGYCFALPDVAGRKMLAEQDSESLVAQSWCRNGPPADVREFVSSRGWKMAQGSVTKLTGGVDSLKDVFRARGQVHHGSNYTSSSSTPNNLKRIGGHAQTAFGGDWSERTLKFFRDKGINYSESNFPVVNHQTWGGSWSGAVAANYWPDWWGPRPQGAWVCSSSQFLANFMSSAYVHLPNMVGWPSDAPVPPPPGETVELTGRLTADNGSPIRGTLTAKSGSKQTKYIVVPDGSGGYVPVVNPF